MAKKKVLRYDQLEASIILALGFCDGFLCGIILNSMLNDKEFKTYAKNIENCSYKEQQSLLLTACDIYGELTSNMILTVKEDKESEKILKELAIESLVRFIQLNDEMISNEYKIKMDILKKMNNITNSENKQKKKTQY